MATRKGRRGPRAVPTIEQIRAYEWAGNHASDLPKFEYVEAFVRANHGTDPGACKEALTIMTRDGMGLGPRAATDKDLRAFLSENS